MSAIVQLDEYSARTLAHLCAGGAVADPGVDLSRLPQQFVWIAKQMASQRNGKDAATVLRALLRETFPNNYTEYLKQVLKMPLDASPPDPALPFHVTPADGILTATFPEVVHIIPGLLPIGLAILGARPKTGKSWMALLIALAVATGGIIFGRRVQQGRVLYLALEDSPRRLQKRMAQQAWTSGLPVDFIHLGQLGEIGELHQGGAESLAAAVRVGGYALTIIDTLERATPSLDHRKEQSEYLKVLPPLAQVAHETNSLVFILDYTRKPNVNGENIVNDLIGTTSKTATVDTIWGLYKEQGKRGAKLQIVGRDVEEQTLVLRFDHQTGCWQSEGTEEELALTAHEKLAKAVEALGGRVRAKPIADLLRQDLSNVTKQLKTAFNVGLLQYDEATKEYFNAKNP